MAKSKKSKMKKKMNTAMVYSDAKQAIKATENNTGGFTAFNIPKGCELFKFTSKGTFKIDIMPYKVKHNPFAEVAPGQYHYQRTYFVHRKIGPDDRDFCCLQKNWGKPCPICEHVGKLNKKGVDPKIVNEFKPKERVLFIFKDRAQKGKVFLFETGHYKSFGAFLNDKLDIFPKGHPNLNFYHLDEKGRTLLISTKADSYMGKAFYPAINIEFIERPKTYDASILKTIPCLDDVPKELKYEELKKIFYQTSKVSGGAAVADDDEDEDTEEEFEDEDEDADEDSDLEETDDDEDEDDYEADEDEEDDDDSDDDSEDEDEEDDEDEDETEDEEDELIGKKVVYAFKDEKIKGKLLSVDGEIGTIKTADGTKVKKKMKFIKELMSK